MNPTPENIIQKNENAYLALLVDRVLEPDDDYFIETAESFDELARLAPKLARDTAMKVLQTRLSHIDKFRYDEYDRGIAFEILYRCARDEAANFIVQHAAQEHVHVLGYMLDEIASDQNLEPMSQELSRAAAVLHEVLGHRSSEELEKISYEVNIFRCNWP